jgi:hypothetical protein
MGQRRRYSREFKLDAVKLARGPGISVKQAARDFDIGDPASAVVEGSVGRSRKCISRERPAKISNY